MRIAVWLLTMVSCSGLITGIGVYAFRRKKPMWFWAGCVVQESELSDLRAYNRANGVMWLCFSLPFWVSTVLGCFHIMTGTLVLVGGCVIGIPALIVAYGRICKKYKR